MEDEVVGGEGMHPVPSLAVIVTVGGVRSVVQPGAAVFGIGLGVGVGVGDEAGDTTKVQEATLLGK